MFAKNFIKGSHAWYFFRVSKHIKQTLDAILHKIVMDEAVHVSFDFLNNEEKEA